MYYCIFEYLRGVLSRTLRQFDHVWVRWPDSRGLCRHVSSPQAGARARDSEYFLRVTSDLAPWGDPATSVPPGPEMALRSPEECGQPAPARAVRLLT